jgi:hypothetical protein
VLRVIVISVLAFLLTPVGGELAEAVIALIADAPADGCRDPLGYAHDADHGCTALMHHCSCCRSIAAETRTTADVRVPDQPVRTAVFVLSRPHAQPDRFDLLRPPSA